MLSLVVLQHNETSLQVNKFEVIRDDRLCEATFLGYLYILNNGLQLESEHESCAKARIRDKIYPAVKLLDDGSADAKAESNATGAFLTLVSI